MENRWERAMLANKVDKIDKRVDKIEKQVDKIEKRLAPVETQLTETVIFLNTMPQKTMQIAIGSAEGFLPDHLEKTKRALKTLGYATASDVAKVTKRARAVESSYLCQLERIGILTGERVGRTKWFRIATKPLLTASESLEQSPSNQSTVEQNLLEI
jgi:hypothetical protein